MSRGNIPQSQRQHGRQKRILAKQAWIGASTYKELLQLNNTAIFVKENLAWEVDSGAFVTQNGDPTLVPSTHIWKKLDVADTLINPVVKKRRQEDSWGFPS